MRSITLFVSAGPVISRAVSEDDSAVERATDTHSDTHSAPSSVQPAMGNLCVGWADVQAWHGVAQALARFILSAMCSL